MNFSIGLIFEERQFRGISQRRKMCALVILFYFFHFCCECICLISFKAQTIYVRLTILRYQIENWKTCWRRRNLRTSKTGAFKFKREKKTLKSRSSTILNVLNHTAHESITSLDISYALSLSLTQPSFSSNSLFSPFSLIIYLSFDLIHNVEKSSSE